jgi:uncharacterized membrane protein YdjX (TVP38/TMEM64 family)
MPSNGSQEGIFSAAAEAMRRILVERARKKGRIKHGGEYRRIDLNGVAAVGEEPRDDLVALDDALTRFAEMEPEKALPGAAVLTLVYGWYLGLLEGVVLVSVASTTGASLAFLLSRFLFRDSIQSRFGERLQSFNASLEKEGPFFLFTLRLIPAVPFFLINAVMGLTPIRARTFWWVSQLGMLPGTIVYVYAGSVVPSLQKLADEGIKAVFSPAQLTQIIVAFALLGVFPLIVRFAMKLMTRSKAQTQSVDSLSTFVAESIEEVQA